MPTRGTTFDQQVGHTPRDFNPRAHEGHDISSFACIRLSPPFQSTCPRGARPVVVIDKPLAERFQSTCPRGARHCLVSVVGFCCYFNPRAHEGHDLLLLQCIFSNCHFNPRAHEGHDVVPLVLSLFGYISIHVPTRGTTRFRTDFDLRQMISIHVPTRGTTYPGSTSPYLYNFNPRAHEGHDLAGLWMAGSVVYFNPRAHEGHDFAM